MESDSFNNRNKKTRYCWPDFGEICQPFFKNEVNLQPHKIRYWLHSTEKAENPEMFAQKVNEICKLYHNAQELNQEGIHVVSTDEMTGIQELEHKYPDKPPLPGQCAKMDFEYIRHSTTSLIGFFDVATGCMEAPYLNPAVQRRIS